MSMKPEKLEPVCADCRHTHKAISWQRELILDLANMLKINLKYLHKDTAEEEWEELGKLIRERVVEITTEATP